MRNNGNVPYLRLVGGMDFEKKRLDIPMESRGVLFERILTGNHPQGNTRILEAAFVKKWAEENARGLLENILATDPSDDVFDNLPKNQREWDVARVVAASIIQWLPTTVGCCFLEESFQRAGGNLHYELPVVKETVKLK